jgi:S23 ribosomal protein.
MTNDEGMTKSEGQNARSEDFGMMAQDLSAKNQRQKRVYDLEERTARFGEAIIDFTKTIPQNPVTNRIISQLVGAGTSVGANYAEADAVSKKDFLKNIGTCRKEARETKHFLR